ncbi:MAG: outer membrane beta-barrel protein [Lewinellaceae bacterium]|nr:outer membrane beta-barrel protein [Lewinellaceae bacterium]
MKNIFSLIVLLLLSLVTQAQRYEVKGTLQDTLGEPLIAATVMLMDMDSILLDYTQTDTKGAFIFKGIKEKNCLLKTSYLGYFPLTVAIQQPNDTKLDLGVLKMTEIAKELMEVVIKEARAPLRLKGDTVEYDASQFKVPEGSTLEALLRRLPGLEVSQEGDIQADGKGVTKLTVDGKTFFSDDPKFAIKNLPAEGVSKVQVFDKKDEEALLTGKSTPSDEKTMNVELKDEFKKGGFGKVTAGVGTENRKELKGNYNKFDSKNQLSLVGVANNTGRNGLSWNDRQDFMGSNNVDDNDDYDYGFANWRYYNQESSLESKIGNAFWSGNNDGFPRYVIGGINYNYDHKKNKVSGRYFFQNNGNDKDILTDSRTFLSEYFLDNHSTENQGKSSVSHKVETRYQYDFDSLLTAIATLDFSKANTSDNQQGQAEIFRDGDLLSSSTEFNNSSEIDGRLMNTSLLLRKKFKKAGRSIGVNGSYLKTDITDFQKRFSDNQFYNLSGILDSTLSIKQLNYDTLDKTVYKVNALMSEPLTKKWFFKVFYNLSSREENGDRYVKDQNEDNSLTLNNGLSRLYQNTITNHRIGSIISYAHKGINFSVGGARQLFDLNGHYASPDVTLFNGRVEKKYRVWLPNVSFGGAITRNTWLSAEYTVAVREPTIENLLPVVDYSNPLYIKEGNPDLLPTYNNYTSLWFNHSWPADAIRIYMSIGYSSSKNQIIQNQTVDENLVTRSKPINFDGGNEVWVTTGISFPIIRNKLKVRTSLYTTKNNSFSIVNDVLNETNSLKWWPNLYIEILPSDKVAIYANSNLSINNTEYNIHTSQNQNIITQNYNIDFNANFAKGWFWNSTLRYALYKNERFGIEQNVPIINLSVYKQILKGNKAEIRLSLYDALNKNISVNQSTSVSRVFSSTTFSLARYVMLSFSYNIKGMKSTVTKNDNYW